MKANLSSSFYHERVPRALEVNHGHHLQTYTFGQCVFCLSCYEMGLEIINKFSLDILFGTYTQIRKRW